MSQITSLPTSSSFDWRVFDAYLFDIDGTLLHSRDWVHYNAFHAALEHVYHCNGRIENVPLHGNTDIGILRATAKLCGIEGGRFETPLGKALAIMREEINKHATDLRPELCPSVREWLERLHEDGKLMGVCTGNLEAIGWAKLKAAGIRERFSVGAFSDRQEFRHDIFRDAMEQAHARLGGAARVCFIGDTPSDIAAAQHLNMPVIAVATGIHDLTTLRQNNPTHCIASCTELL